MNPFDDPISTSTPPTTESTEGVSPAVGRFKSCRWRAQGEQGAPVVEHCTHRDVLPFAGREGFKPDAWCPDCKFYKLRRTPKRREMY